MKSHFCSLLISVLFFASGVFAQSSDGTLLITVKDPLGSAVAEAEVSLGRPDLKVREAKTNLNGIARFDNLPAGEFRLTISAAGFKEYSEEKFLVRGGETRRTEITLEIAPIESEVDVGENEAVSAENAGAAMVLNEKEIANLPDDQEQLERAIRRMGEAVAGEELPVTVNGVQGGKIPPKDAIQQIRVNNNVFSAQYDSAFGGGVEIFTRSNVDKYRGYASFTFADSRLNAGDPFLGRRVPYQSRSYYFNGSGPLFGSKKANFFVYGGHSEVDSNAVVNATVLDAELRPTPFKQTLATPTRSDNVNFVVNADPTKKHKLYLNYNFSIGRSGGQNVGGFSLPSRTSENETRNHYVQFSDTFLINPNVVNQSRLLVTYFTNESVGDSSAAGINVLDAFFGGGSQQNNSSKNLRFDAANETTWQMGRYALGFGFRIRGERISQNSTANFGGTYTFSGRLAPVLTANNEPVTDVNGNIVRTQIDSLETYRRTLLFGQLGFTGQRIRELGGGPNQFTISGGDPKLDIAQYDAAFYVQNSYKISETIAASFGVRYENQTNIDSYLNLAPRFGVIWAPKTKEKEKLLYTLPRVSIGYGLFYSRYGLNNTVVIRQANGDRRQYLINETAVLDNFPAVPTVGQLQQFALPRTRRFIEDDFETPYQSLLNVVVTKRMPKKYSLVFTLSRGRTYRQALTQNINAPRSGTFQPNNPSAAVRPFGNVGNIYETSSIGRAHSDRFSVNLNFPQSQKLFANLRYSYSRVKGSVVSGSGSPFDPYDFDREFGSSPFDGVHNVGGYMFLTLPRRFNVGGDFSISSGTKYNITTGRDTNGDGFYSERPAFAADPNKPGVIATPYGLLDPNPLPGDRIIPRNFGRGDAVFVFNSFFSKTFGFNEDKKNKKPPKQTINFSLRANNVFNIINKANPIGNMASPNFLRSLSSFDGGGVIFINGAQQINFPGRSLSLSVGVGF